MRKFGLIGYPLTHSFSEKYFSEKFLAENITDAAYQLFELPEIHQFPNFLRTNSDLKGLNVTIPHKQAIIPFLDELDDMAARIGAVNVIKFSAGKLVGYNSDYLGFLQALKNFYPIGSATTQALILGNGGASKSVQAALDEINIPYQIVSRRSGIRQITYSGLTPEIIKASTLIINTTPLGTFPDIDQCPPIPYEHLSSQHYLFDLVYNPSETLFMRKGKANGAKVKNGYEMLCRQAEVAWQIWNG